MAERVEMETVIRHSRVRATGDAVVLWALSSAQYPLDHRLIQDQVTVMVVEAVSSFSLSARRALEVVLERPSIKLNQPRWNWVPKAKGEVVVNLWDAVRRIIHARKLDVGWEELPKDVSVIPAGAIIIPYVQAETDRRALAFIDPFALAHAFLYQALPLLDSYGNAAGGGRPN
jgi:hypothetical protein